MPGIKIEVHTVEVGVTPYAVLQQSDDSGLGLIWNRVAVGWQASPSSSDRKITLVQDSEIASSWDTQTVQLGNYSGDVVVHVFDDSDDSFLQTGYTSVLMGNEIDLAAGQATEAKQDQMLTAIGSIGGTVGLSARRVDETRTWFLPGIAETGLSPQIVTLNEGDVVTLAMDFKERLNDDTALQTISSVVDSLATLTFDNTLVDREFRRAHFDVTGLVSGCDHVLTVRAVTSDGQTISGKGRLEVA